MTPEMYLNQAWLGGKRWKRRVTGVFAGSATITAIINDGGLTATCAITVTPVDKKFYFKETSTTWTEQTILDNVFDSNTNYIQGN